MNDIKMFLYDVETGEKLTEIKGIDEIQLETNIRYETKYDEDNYSYIDSFNTGSYEMTLDYNVTDMSLNKLLGFDEPIKKPDAYDITYTKIVQRRKHKKKRINKKWAKRYGYKPVDVVFKGWEVKLHSDSTFEFKKNIK